MRIPLLDYKTLLTVLALLIANEGLEKSGFLKYISHITIGKAKSLIGVLCLSWTITLVLSPILTNDAALLAVLPLLSHRFRRNTPVFMVAAITAMANAASSLTPFGNPQNAFIWHFVGCSLQDFVIAMFPAWSILVISVLAVFLPTTYLTSRLYKGPKKSFIPLKEAVPFPNTSQTLFFIAFLGITLWLLSTDKFLKAGLLILLTLALSYFLFRTVAISKTSAVFLLVLVAMMIVPSSLSRILNPYLSRLGTMKLGDFWLGVILSQIISNVPATILAAGLSKHIWHLSWGVNAGGNGMVWSSLATLIGLRFLPEKNFKHILLFQGLIIISGLASVVLLSLTILR